MPLLLLLAAVVATGLAGDPRATFIERAEFRNANYFRLMSSTPSGEEIADRYGPRALIGVESRALSKYGVGVSVSAEAWWSARDTLVTTFIPLSAGLLYGYPFFGGAVVPYAGVFVSYSFASLRHADGDLVVRGTGAGPGSGAAIGVEFPLFEKYRIKGEARFSTCRIAVGGDHQRTVDFSRTDLGIGLSMGLTDVCLW
ncbi:MAG: hypothetical protein R6X14_03640 [bacterium]